MSKPVITDITNLFIEDIIINNLQGQYFLWYRYDEIFDDITLDNEENENILDDILETAGFTKYQPIACAVLNFAFDSGLLDDCDSDESDDSDDSCDCNHGIHIIHVMVDERSKFAKGHQSPDETGFVKLFSLFLDSDFTIVNVAFNIKLVSKRIQVTSGKKEYPTVPEDIDETDETDDTDNTNDIECTVCLSSKGTLVETPCKHKFHLQCLRCVPNLKCPLCREDIQEFLQSNGIPKEEIETRLKDQKNESELEQICQIVDSNFIANLNEIDFIRACMYTLKLNNCDPIAYMELVFDMNANASELFAEISFLNSKKEKGIFMYHYNYPTDLIFNMIDMNSESVVQWRPVSYFKGSLLEDIVNQRINKITDFKNEYVVLVMIDKVVNAHILTRDANKNPNACRLHKKDILVSLLKCVRCRSSGNSNNAPNREYIWARYKLKKMKRNIKNKENKKNKKNTKETKDTKDKKNTKDTRKEVTSN